jgi:hypothetical protein
VYVLKRGLAHLAAGDITVIEYNEENVDVPLAGHTVGRRYRTVFGDGIKWSARGLDGWLIAAPV